VLIFGFIVIYIYIYNITSKDVWCDGYEKRVLESYGKLRDGLYQELAWRIRGEFGT
jgi:hypothetical protein